MKIVTGRIRRTVNERRFGWLRSFAQLTEDLEMVHLRSHSGLIPLPDGSGAFLAWVFDIQDGVEPMLLVRLTESEAQRVYEADPFTVGMLEPVRRSIKNDWALMMVRNGPRKYWRPFKIPRSVSESEFVATMDAALAGCPAHELETDLRAGASKDDVRAVTRAEILVRGLAMA